MIRKLRMPTLLYGPMEAWNIGVSTFVVVTLGKKTEQSNFVLQA